jgi:hypothetical protein
MGYKLDFGKLAIGKKLRNVSDETIYNTKRSIVYEEDKVEATLLPSKFDQVGDTYKYKDL